MIPRLCALTVVAVVAGSVAWTVIDDWNRDRRGRRR